MNYFEALSSSDMPSIFGLVHRDPGYGQAAYPPLYAAFRRLSRVNGNGRAAELSATSAEHNCRVEHSMLGQHKAK